MKVLINRTDAIGDLILTTPVAQAIKSKYPDAHITFLISKKCEDIAKSCPFIDDYYIVAKKNIFSDAIDLWRFIRDGHFDTYLHFGGRQLPNLLSFVAQIPFRGGLRSKWQTFIFLNKAVRQKRSLVEMHEIEYNLHVLSPLGITCADACLANQFRPVFALSELERTQDYLHFIEALPDDLKDFKEIIFIHPGMTGHTLNWPESNFAQLAIRLFQLYGKDFLLILSFTPSDQRYVDNFKLSLRSHPEVLSRIYFLDGTKKGLLHYMHILSHASIFVGPSTGTTHIANTLGIKTVGIYSPIKVQSAKRWGPAHRNKDLTRVLVPDVVCGERFQCAGEECPYYACMGVIAVDQAVQSIKDLLKGENS